MNIHDPKLIDDFILGGALGREYSRSKSPNFLERCAAEGRWLDSRLNAGVDPYQCFTTGRGGPRVSRANRGGVAQEGINFGSQDYLSLSTHPALIRAAGEAAHAYGVHSAGSAGLAGLLDITLKLETELAAFLGYRDVTLFPIGWAAGYGVITSLIRPTDHIIIDRLAHACLQEGSRNATKNTHISAHLSVEAVEKKLQQIRAGDPDSGILVVTETLFSMDSDVADIAALQSLCHQYGATLLVDCAHDLGAVGETGRGYLELQNMIGEVDILMGSFSKTFASNGGFVACNEPGMKARLRGGCGPSTFTNAMTPLQVAVIRRALSIVDSEEGQRRRASLAENTLLLRRLLENAGFETRGEPSAIVPVMFGQVAKARLATRYATDAGAFVNLIETPAVPKNACRWRLQVMADHTKNDIEEFVEIAIQAREMAGRHLSARAVEDSR